MSARLFNSAPGFPAFAAAGEGAAAAAPAEAPPAAAPPAAAPPAEAPAAAAGAWYAAAGLDAETASWLTAKGFNDADPAQAAAGLAKSARAAEKLIGKSPEAVLDRPGKDQSLTDWRRANAAALGLPAAEDAYGVAAPEDWPKDIAWDAGLEAEARKFAFAQGVDPETHKGYVAIFAKKMQGMLGEEQGRLERANTAMMADLQRSHGDRLPGLIAGAQQAAQYFAAQAGLDGTGIAHVARLVAKETGDAATIRFFAAIGQAMGEDSGLGIGKGAVPFGTSPDQARAELKTFQSPDGEYGKAFAANDLRKLAELKPKREALAKLAALAP